MIEYGYVCFAYSKNEWIAKAIAWFTRSQWSHSFITIPKILDREMAMEAGGNGVSAVPFDIAYRNNSNQKYEVYRFKCDSEKIDYAISKCMNKLETSYGYLEYPWFIWRSLNFLFKRDIKIQNNWSSQGTICSGLVRAYLEEAGYVELFKEYGIDSNSAQDVYNIVKSHSDLFELIEQKS